MSTLPDDILDEKELEEVNTSSIDSDNREELPNTVLDISNNVESIIDDPEINTVQKILESKLSGVRIQEIKDADEKTQQQNIFTIEITDPEIFLTEENLREMVPYFGKLIFDTFEERGKEREFKLDTEEKMQKFIEEYFLYGDLSSTDKIYAIADGEQIQGFYFIRYNTISTQEKVAQILITTVDRPFRGTGIHRKITETVFQEEKDVAGFTGLTHTPEAVKSLLYTAQKTGYDLFFCNRKNGNRNLPLSEEEKQRLHTLREDIDYQVKSYEFDDLQDGLSEEYVSYGTLSIPPRKLEEVHLNPSDPLYETFRDLVEFQQKNRPGEALYGTLYMVPKKKEKEELIS